MPDRRMSDDFPKVPEPGAIAHVQTKLLIREVDGRYQNALTDAELWVRYDACEDLAAQLAEYASHARLHRGAGSGYVYLEA